MRWALGTVCALVALVLVPVAAASESIDGDAKLVSFEVDAKGEAGLVYDTPARGRRYVLLWGAVDAIVPAVRGGSQVTFRKDYAGGHGVYRKNVVRTMVDTCRPYDGPALPLLVAACRAGDGSYWALQAWPRPLPNLGLDPWRPEQRITELHVSHWTGPISVLTGRVNWTRSGLRQLFGTFSHGGSPVFGFTASRTGVPLDSWGRNVYLDTLDSAYGPGWKRENSFLAHTGTGVFCYVMGRHEPYPGYPPGTRQPGNGKRYRLTAMGPGVTPIVRWEGPDPGAFDARNPVKARLEESLNAELVALGDPQCAPG